MQLFWQRLKPAMQTESFLEDAIIRNYRACLPTDEWLVSTKRLKVMVSNFPNWELLRPLFRS